MNIPQTHQREKPRATGSTRTTSKVKKKKKVNVVIFCLRLLAGKASERKTGMLQQITRYNEKYLLQYWKSQSDAKLCCICDCRFPLIVKPLTCGQQIESFSERRLLLHNLTAAHAVGWQMTASPSFWSRCSGTPGRLLLTWLLFL